MAKDHKLAAHATLMMWYMIMVFLAGLVYATTSNQKFADFLGFFITR